MAGRLAKRLGSVELERKVYLRLASEMPGMPLWRAKIDALKANLGSPAKP